MANVIIPQRFWSRRGTAAALTSANEVLYSGEWCYETDTGKAKIGDGVTAWSDLAYFGDGAASEQTYNRIDGNGDVRIDGNGDLRISS